MKEQDFTSGNIFKQLFLFFIPILIGTFFQQLYNTVDTMIVGKVIGTNALAAVGSTANITALVVYFFVGLSTGAGVVVAQYFGAKERDMMKRAVSTSIVLAVFCGIIMMIYGVFFARVSLKAIGVPGKVLNESVIYMQIYFLSMIPACIYNIGASILRSVGDSKTPLFYLTVCSIVNIVGDLVFIIVFHMGVAGAALATTLAQTVCAILVLQLLSTSTKDYALDLHHLSLDKNILKEILQIGIPSGLQSCMWSVSNIVLQTHINIFGTIAIASWTVYGKLDTLFWLIIGAVGQSVTTFIGQNYGAKNYSRIEEGNRTGLLMAIAGSLLFSVFMFTLGKPLSGLFTSDVKVVKEFMMILYLLTPFYVFYSFVEIYSATMRGCGNSFIPLIITALGICVLRIVFVVFISPKFGTFKGVMVAYPVTWVVTGSIFIIVMYFFKKKLLKRENL